MAIWRALKIFFKGSIMLNKEMIIKMVKDFELLFKVKPLVLAGAAMVLHGVKSETRDIDLYIPLADYERLAFFFQKDKNGVVQLGFLEIGSSITGWEMDPSYDVIDGLHVHTLEGIVQFKKNLGREKDFIDIKIIEAFLQKA